MNKLTLKERKLVKEYTKKLIESQQNPAQIIDNSIAKFESFKSEIVKLMDRKNSDDSAFISSRLAFKEYTNLMKYIETLSNSLEKIKKYSKEK